jgi:hypothetical protein
LNSIEGFVAPITISVAFSSIGSFALAMLMDNRDELSLIVILNGSHDAKTMLTNTIIAVVGIHTLLFFRLPIMFILAMPALK